MEFTVGLVRRPFVATALLIMALSGSAYAATFGTVVNIPGHMSDIALDNTRGVVYAANFTASRIEVVSMFPPYTLLNPILVANQPSSIAMSPDGHYLVVGHYVSPSTPSAAVTVIDLNTSSKRTLSLGSNSVLAVAFGNGAQALIVHTGGVSLLDPDTGTFTTLAPVAFSGTALPVAWNTFPSQIIQASAGVSGDGNMIYALVNVGTNPAQIVQFNVRTGVLAIAGVTATPLLGPVAVSVDQTGATLMAGWGLINSDIALLAQFPYANGALNVGGHAFDWSRNLIYAQAPLSATQTASAPLLHIMDSDNLTVREKLQLRENLAGKALLSGNNMYAISDSGLTIFPIGSLTNMHRVQAVQEDLLFQGSGCNQTVVSQYLDIVDPSGGATDFTLKVSSPNVRLSALSGTTPARIQVLVDPTAFQSNKGTSTIQLQIASTQAINVPQPVRLLINTRDPDQQGVIYNVPGTIVDVLADPARDRFYVLRQDKNQVLVFDGTSFKQLATLRTGNTPVQMAIFKDYLFGSWLLVTNDNSQLISVFDLGPPIPLDPQATPKPADPVFLPPGLYGRSIAITDNNRILATTRGSNSTSPSPVVGVSLAAGFSVAPSSWGIYKNLADPRAALAASPSGRMIFMPTSDGTVNLFDSQASAFISSRKYSSALSGAYTALSEGLFFAGGHVFDTGMVDVGDVDLLGGVSSGAALVDGRGLLTVTPSTTSTAATSTAASSTTAAATTVAATTGVMQRFSMDQFASISPVRTGEAPAIPANLITTPVDQTGQTLLSFMRTLAPLTNRKFMVQLSTSGFTTMPWGFDKAIPAPVITAVTNAADGDWGVAPGGLISIWGSNLSNSNAQAGSVPLPRGLGDSCLYANSLAMPLLFVSPNQINAQLPFNMPANATIAISNSNGQSNAFDFTVRPTAPAVFRTGNGTAVIVRTVDGKMITDQTPIHLNQVLNIYMTGLGAVSANVNPGDPSPSDPLATTMLKPEITIGGASIFTLWSGLAPGFVGVYQVNAQVPFHGIPTGSKVPFTITVGGATTSIMLPVQE